MGRADLLCGVFYLLALLTFMSSCDNDEPHFAPVQDQLITTDGLMFQYDASNNVTTARVIRKTSESQQIMQLTRLKLWLSMVFAILALLSKEQGLTVFGLFIIYRLRILCKRSDSSFHW